MDYDPDAMWEEGYEAAQDELDGDFDRIVDEEELFGEPEELDEKDVFPDAAEMGLVGAFAHMIADERDTELSEDLDEQNFRTAMSMCTASGEPRVDGPNDRPFEAYVRATINTPGFFKRRTK